MKSTLFASTALALVLSAGAAFAGPTATINQGGLNNDVYIKQAGAVHPDTSASVTQDAAASENYAQVEQLGAGKSLATIAQIGGSQSDNGGDGTTFKYGAGIRQDVTSGAVEAASVAQNGDKNRGEISQGGGSNLGSISQGGSDLKAGVIQDGANQANVTQTGSVNIAGIDQRGDGNFINTGQSNSGNVATLSQGMDENWDPTVPTNGAVLYTSQTGFNGRIETYQTGTGSQWASIAQTGSADRALLVQSGNALNTAYITQDGNETATVTQRGGGHVNVDQTGSDGGNVATVSQNALAASTTVFQSGSVNIAAVTQEINGANVGIVQSGNGGFASVMQK